MKAENLTPGSSHELLMELLDGILEAELSEEEFREKLDELMTHLHAKDVLIHLLLKKLDENGLGVGNSEVDLEEVSLRDMKIH
jgi:hypothetical protein